jgi:inosine-uridine nucleoside N-ribohydrolase
MTRSRSGKRWPAFGRAALLEKAMIVSRWFHMSGVALFMLAGCGDAGSQATPRAPLIIDTDMAHDDAMAIAYLLRRDDVEVQAITVTGTGMARLEAGTQNALGLLTLAGQDDVVVAQGGDTPLAGDNPSFIPEAWRDDADTLLGVALPPSSLTASSVPAPTLLREKIRSSPEPVTLVALGPLTNVAQAIMDEPTIIDGIGRIYIMGGAVDVAGNVQYGGDETNPYAEWNIFLDPTAARIVLESGAQITLVPLDATGFVPGTVAYAQRMAAEARTPEATFVASLLAELERAQALDDWFDFWDALAAVISTEPTPATLATLEQRAIQVITADGIESGRTMPDSAGTTIDVATTANAAAFEDLFLQVLNSQ